MSDQNIAEINRKAWNKIVKEGRTIHASKGGKEEKLLDVFIQSLPISAKLLDLGCGTGIPIGKHLYDAGFEMVGVDVSDEMIKQYQKNLPGSRSFRMPMTQIAWSNEFDGIVSSYSMLCLPPKDFTLVAKRIHEALKEKGWFLLFLNEGSSEEGAVQEVQGQQMFSMGVSEQEIRDNFETLGMKIINIERETEYTKEYGVENSMYVLMQKT